MPQVRRAPPPSWPRPQPRPQAEVQRPPIEEETQRGEGPVDGPGSLTIGEQRLAVGLGICYRHACQVRQVRRDCALEAVRVQPGREPTGRAPIACGRLRVQTLLIGERRGPPGDAPPEVLAMHCVAAPVVPDFPAIHVTFLLVLTADLSVLPVGARKAAGSVRGRSDEEGQHGR
jgi:hypothetical protein